MKEGILLFTQTSAVWITNGFLNLVRWWWWVVDTSSWLLWSVLYVFYQLDDEGRKTSSRRKNRIVSSVPPSLPSVCTHWAVNKIRIQNQSTEKNWSVNIPLSPSDQLQTNIMEGELSESSVCWLISSRTTHVVIIKFGKGKRTVPSPLPTCTQLYCFLVIF